jgi:protease II
MIRRAITLCLATLLAACSAPQETSVKNLPAAPVARREAIVEQLHGVAIADPYRWLEDGDSDEVKAWADGQDLHARAVVNGVKGHELLTARFSSLLYVDSISTPVARKGRLFYMRRPKGAEKSFLAWRDESGEERVLIDTAKLSADGKSVRLQIEDLRTVMQQAIKFDLVAKDGTKVAQEVQQSIHEVPGVAAVN